MQNQLFRLIATERARHPELTTYKTAEAHVLQHHPAEYRAATLQPQNPVPPAAKPRTAVDHLAGAVLRRIEADVKAASHV